ncbi:MAG: GFA family protein [Pseudomonadales bacterium]|nr:GFA family protein [Pseudomonadales bacterium]
MKRKAICQCGQLSVTTIGEPIRVAMCHCEECQRRTGSAFNLGAVFDESNVELRGEFSTYKRTGEQGNEVEFHFCPKCGSNVHWIFGGVHVVAVGCYADPTFPQPTVSLYGKRRHHWMPRLDDVPGFVGNRESEQE